MNEAALLTARRNGKQVDMQDLEEGHRPVIAAEKSSRDQRF